MACIDQLRKRINVDDLRYLNSYQTKPFRLFKSEYAAKLTSDLSTTTNTSSRSNKELAKRMELVDRAKAQWASMDIEQKLYYCQMADCFHSRAKLALIRRCKFKDPQDGSTSQSVVKDLSSMACQQPLVTSEQKYPVTIYPQINLVDSSTVDNNNNATVSSNTNYGAYYGHGMPIVMPAAPDPHHLMPYFWPLMQPLYFSMPPPPPPLPSMMVQQQFSLIIPPLLPAPVAAGHVRDAECNLTATSCNQTE